MQTRTEPEPNKPMIPNYNYGALHFGITMGGMRSPADTMKVRCPLRQHTLLNLLERHV
ncbi:hypothetical protein [Nostoc sp. DSM 114161]|uniref:hypothetical protein n=1 Tax=Nostoc sp. DSM 114161 TaxID=3440143 RepID=UPI00404627E1